MRKQWLLGGALALIVPACTSSSSPGDSADAGQGDASYTDGGTICDTFTHSGQPCAPAGPTVCFRQCKKDGCLCVATAGGGGLWACTTDFSCTPDAGPLADAAGQDADSIDARGD